MLKESERKILLPLLLHLQTTKLAWSTCSESSRPNSCDGSDRTHKSKAFSQKSCSAAQLHFGDISTSVRVATRKSMFTTPVRTGTVLSVAVPGELTG